MAAGRGSGLHGRSPRDAGELGYRGEDAKEKKLTMDTYWIPGVNNLKTCGRWAVAEFTAVWERQANFEEKVESVFEMLLEAVAGDAVGKE